MQVGDEQDEGRRDAEVDEIGKQIEFRAEARGALERPGDPPVEPVEHRRAGDGAHRPFDRALHRQADRGQAEAQREQRHDVRQQEAQRHRPEAALCDASAPPASGRGVCEPSFTRLSSAGTAAAARRARDLGDHRFPRDGARIESDDDLRVRRKIDVDARAEADEADALAGAHLHALAGEADDAASDQTRDLHDAEPSGRRVDDDAVAFVVFARLVEIGAEEEPGMIDDALDAPFDRRAVHVAIEHRHEDRYALQRPHSESELGGGAAKPAKLIDAVGRAR